MSYVTIRIYDSPIEANLIRAKIENEGITCFLMDENLVSMDPLLSNAIGGIKLKVHKNERSRAEDILNSLEQTKLTNEENEVVECPQCGSNNLNHNQKSIKSIKGVISTIVSLMFLTYPMHYKIKKACKDCRHEFE